MEYYWTWNVYFKAEWRKKKDSVQFSFNLWPNPSGNTNMRWVWIKKILLWPYKSHFRTLNFTFLSAFYGTWLRHINATWAVKYQLLLVLYVPVHKFTKLQITIAPTTFALPTIAPATFAPATFAPRQLLRRHLLRRQLLQRHLLRRYNCSGDICSDDNNSATIAQPTFAPPIIAPTTIALPTFAPTTIAPPKNAPWQLRSRQ